MKDEGYIKYSANWEEVPLHIDHEKIDEMNRIRSFLKGKGWIGVMPDGVGFGNISIRLNTENQFLITGSATGHLEILSRSHFSRVNHVDLENNQLDCTGETIASSESMTHAAIYQTKQEINVVIHIHNRKLWEQFIHRLPTSDKNAKYGTPEMAQSIVSMVKETSMEKGVFVMGGHEEGLIGFGKNLDDVLQILQELSVG